MNTTDTTEPTESMQLKSEALFTIPENEVRLMWPDNPIVHVWDLMLQMDGWLSVAMERWAEAPPQQEILGRARGLVNEFLESVQIEEVQQLAEAA